MDKIIIVALAAAKQYNSTRIVYHPQGLSPCLVSAMGMGGGYVPMILLKAKK